MGGLGFLSPLLLAFSALAIPIVLLYMLRLRRSDMSISSTFLWQQLIRDREANAPWQRLRPNLLMFLQLLILAALVLALARPFKEVKTITTGRIVLLLDASASMNATDIDGKTRYSEAQKLALDTLETLGSDDTMTIIRVGEVPEVLAAASRDRSILRKAIQESEVGLGSADWSAALTLAAAGGRGVDTLRVVILSDGGLPQNLPTIAGDIKYVKIGESNENVAITALSTRTLPNQAPQLFAQLSNLGDSDTRVVLALHLDGALYDSQFHDLAAHSTQNVIIENLPSDFSKLEAVLSASSSSPTPNHLSNDDTAYAVNAETATGRVLLMTESNIFIEQIFESISGLEVVKSNPNAGIPSGDYDLIIFDSWLPTTELPNADLMLIDPPQSTSFFDVVGQSSNPRINSVTQGIVDKEDERTRYVNFANVNIRQFRVLSNMNWATPLIETESGDPLLLAGEVNNRQISILTFRLQDSDLPLQLAWPIMVARLMEWYRPQRAITVDNLTPGEALLIHPSVEADSIQIRRPDGDRDNFALNDAAEFAYADTLQPGFYDIEVLLDDNVVQRDTFAVNLFDLSESNIAPLDSLQIQTADGQTTVSSTAQEETGRRELWRYLAYAGLLILGIEWWYYHHGLNRKPKALDMSFLPSSQRAAATARRSGKRM